ncbi:hypothetical protein HanPI659440_Chr14g0553721 [Helianthus annuus]|nr:hypothetical protein HanPI659440_Chr14g0553721 [Helianthus annuus]
MSAYHVKVPWINTLTWLGIIHFMQLKDEAASPLRIFVISIVWLALKNGVSEYLAKQTISKNLPSVLGRHSFNLLYAVLMQVPQMAGFIFSAHCAIAYTVAFPLVTCLMFATYKLDVFGVASLISDKNSATLCV